MKTDEIIEKSIFIITEYYKNNLHPFFENISENILWVGPAEGQQIQGKENIIQAFSAEEHNLTFTMGDITAVSISPNTSVREVLLHYDIFTHYPSGNTDLHDQLLHYTWNEKRTKTDSGHASLDEIVMIHISNAWKYDSRDKIYPVHYETLSTQLLSLPQTETWVTVKASDTSFHRIAASHILYMETVKHATRLLVHTISETIMINGTLPDFEKNYPDIFLRIHASYLINPYHVKEIRRFRVTLSDGTELPVPEKKYTRIKKLILENHSKTTHQSE